MRGGSAIILLIVLRSGPPHRDLAGAEDRGRRTEARVRRNASYLEVRTEDWRDVGDFYASPIHGAWARVFFISRCTLRVGQL